MSTIRKGAYYVNRTKQWLEDQGYMVERVEHSERIMVRDRKTGELKVIFRKRDLWGADICCRNEEHMIFVQVKSNRGQVSDGIKQLSVGPWPRYIGRWVVWWPLRRRMDDGPEIVEVDKLQEVRGEHGR